MNKPQDHWCGRRILFQNCNLLFFFGAPGRESLTRDDIATLHTAVVIWQINQGFKDEKIKANSIYIKLPIFIVNFFAKRQIQSQEPCVGQVYMNFSQKSSIMCSTKIAYMQLPKGHNWTFTNWNYDSSYFHYELQNGTLDSTGQTWPTGLMFVITALNPSLELLIERY